MYNRRIAKELLKLAKSLKAKDGPDKNARYDVFVEDSGHRAELWLRNKRLNQIEDAISEKLDLVEDLEMAQADDDEALVDEIMEAMDPITEGSNISIKGYDGEWLYLGDGEYEKIY
jgi:hypothetical protein